MDIKKASKLGANDNVAYLITSNKDLSSKDFSAAEIDYIKKEIKAEQKQITLNRLTNMVYVVVLTTDTDYKAEEKARIAGHNLTTAVNQAKIKSLSIVSDLAVTLSFIEGISLTNYQFLKYFSDKKINTLTELNVLGEIETTELVELQNTVDATNYAKDLVNEPQSFLTATQISEEIKTLGKEAGFTVEVFNKEKIEALEMGGLLAVNKGSIEPPTFSILEWKPKNAKNKKPIVLVGKGVVYDTGGLSLKPTANSMDIMKSDMGGAATVMGATYLAAKQELPIHIITLIPATDNRPGLNAYAPGDIVTMLNGLTVEVLNTDAEGRMILADALTYSKKFDPELVIDAATLTGAAHRAVGEHATCIMGTAKQTYFNQLEQAGFDCHERTMTFPFWEEYGEELKSPIADLKNLGGPSAGMITAGKFLENFVEAPYIHMDIAGPAWLDKTTAYRTRGGSGVGVRLLYNFFKSMK